MRENPSAAASTSLSTQPRAFQNYVESVLEILARDPERLVLTDTNGEKISAGALHDSVHRTAAELADRGIGRGTTVSLLTGNRPEALSARYAANLLGARVAFLHEVVHTHIAPDVVAHIVKSIDSGILLIDPALHEMAEALLSHPDHPTVLFLGPSPLGEDLTSCAARHDGRRLASAAHPDDDWCIRLTGGTTGIPKSVCMTYANYQDVVIDRVTLLNRRSPHLPHTDTPPCFLACASIAHSAGTTTDATLLAGGRVVLQRQFVPGEVLAAIARERVTDVWMLSPMLGQVLDHPSAGSTDVSSLRRVSYGGHLLAADRWRRANEVFGPVLYGWYGQTEAGLMTEVQPHEHTLIGRTGQITAGRPVPGAEIAVCDSAGNRLKPGETGEIRARSPQVMSGYWKQPELSAELLEDGWLRTGDAGYLDDAGYLYISGRIKEMIKLVGSHQVFPAELESFLLSHPAVEHCMVFGVRRPDDSEEVHAAIVPTPGHTVDNNLIRDFVVTHKGKMYVPSALHMLTEMPLNAVGKPDKKQVQTQLGVSESSVTVY
ncbi:AMP-binding protein [Streptomyces sp. N2-109]|uniref:AMP-binding protein n=1 Tax=Streptomyces gossypii TaxID=2883101 RepID=A0ABT2JSU8_9ACTN|nr:AMP-binding protein [Streptomyces gossypii]MCT2590961.1 AMP-binding protein [Streptomyces gossypii]